MDTGRLGAMVKTTQHALQQQQQQQQSTNGNGAAGGAVAAVRLLSGKDSPSGGRSPTTSFGSNTPTARRSMEEFPVGTSLAASTLKMSASQSAHDTHSMSLDMRLTSLRHNQ